MPLCTLLTVKDLATGNLAVTNKILFCIVTIKTVSRENSAEKLLTKHICGRIEYCVSDKPGRRLLNATQAGRRKFI